jgi:hypothetical protein
MRIIKLLFSLLFLLVIEPYTALAQENAAPSMHLSYYFGSSDAVLKMQKIKIVQSAYASYFEINWFTSGYAGLQQTPDTRYGKSNILISSLWDQNTAAGIFSKVDYSDPKTIKSRFGGEGDGWKTIHPYDWKMDTWYNLVNRAWKSHGSLCIGTFIQDLSTGKWFHTATLSIPYPARYLNSYNDAFLENWDGSNPAWDGRFIRKAFFKDCWNLTITGSWQKNNRAFFSANNSEADINRNGLYHNSFNAWYDMAENAYCMQHGGNTTPSAAFNGGRTLDLPVQSNQGSVPSLTIAAITSFYATYNSGTVEANWTIDEFKSPQLSAKIEILNAAGTVLLTFQDTIPQRRNFTKDTILDPGDYTARLRIRDIFNQLVPRINTTFLVAAGPTLTLSDSLLTIAAPDSSTAVFDIRSNVAWSAASNQSWVTVGNATGIGNAIQTLVAAENKSADSRIALVTISGSGVEDQTITVTQVGASSGLDEIPEKDMTAYPNPAGGHLFFSGVMEGMVTIFDGGGKLVCSQEVKSAGIDISTFPEGVYIWKIKGEKGWVGRFIKR